MMEQSLLKQISNAVRPHVWCSQIDGKVIAFDLRNSTKNHHLSLVCWAFLEPIVHNRPLLLIGHFDRLKVHLSNGKKRRMGLAHIPYEISLVCVT